VEQITEQNRQLVHPHRRQLQPHHLELDDGARLELIDAPGPQQRGGQHDQHTHLTAAYRDQGGAQQQCDGGPGLKHAVLADEHLAHLLRQEYEQNAGDKAVDGVEAEHRLPRVGHVTVHHQVQANQDHAGPYQTEHDAAHIARVVEQIGLLLVGTHRNTPFIS
jgi:hypothetical protein